MEQLSENSTPKKLPSSLKINTQLLIHIILAIILLPMFINYLNIIPLAKIYPDQLGWLPQKLTPTILAPQVPAKKTVEEASLAIPYSILQNPMVYEWKGSVEGVLIAKTDNSITIAGKNKSTITIPINTGSTGTKFFFQADIKKGDLDKLISFDKVTLNSWLVGDFFVLSKQSKIYGSSFMIMDTK